MKNQYISFFLLILCSVITILEGKLSFDLYYRFPVSLTLVGVSLYHFFQVLMIISNSPYKSDRYRIVSGIIFIFSAAFLAVFQFARISVITNAIHIMVIVNGLYSYFLFYKKYNNILATKHLIFSAFLMGIGIFNNV